MLKIFRKGQTARDEERLAETEVKQRSVRDLLRPDSNKIETESDSFSDWQRAKEAGDHWDGVVASAPHIKARSAWWNDPPTIQHINRLICGVSLDKAHEGFHVKLREKLLEAGLTLPRAISVGSGNGAKEIGLLETGIVGTVDCFEAGLGACQEGRYLAERQGVADRIRFFNENAFDRTFDACYDLVYWNSALHHMPDTIFAVEWSRSWLRTGGLFAMDEYVGASYFQHSDGLMALTNAVLATLPQRLLLQSNSQQILTLPLGRINKDDLIKIDPTEATDSANILPALEKVFPGANVILTGGGRSTLLL